VAKQQRVLLDIGMGLDCDWRGIPAGTMLPAGKVVFRILLP